MNKKLEKLISKNENDEILRIVESKTTKPNQAYKKLVLTPLDWSGIKKYTTGCILKDLHSGNTIAKTPMKISLLLGDEYLSEIKSLVCNSIVSLKTLEVSQFIQNNFLDLSSLETTICYIEGRLDAIYRDYDNLPGEWCIDLRILTRSLIILKEVICNNFFTSDPAPEILVKGLKTVISFEKKLDQFFTLKKCCVDTVEFVDDECFIRTNPKDVRCIHRRMLSSLFIPHIDMFIDFTLRKILNTKFEQNKVEKNIIRIFIDYFHDLENIYEFLNHFEEKSIFQDLFTINDKILYMLLQKLKVDENASELIILYSTVLYIQKILEDFSVKLLCRFQIECASTSLAASIKLEKSIDSRIEREIFNNFPEEITNISTVIDELFRDFLYFDDEVKKNIVEIVMIQMLLKIGKLKFNQAKAHDFLQKLCDLEDSLGKRYNVPVNYGIVRDYLSIFNWNIEDPSGFIENFRKHSNGKFELTMVLKALEDQQSAQEIYQVFINMDRC